jgi:hypothetical protein
MNRFILPIAAMIAAGSTSASAVVLSSFGSSSEGWTGSGATVVWNATTQDLTIADADTSWATLDSPGAFHGSWTDVTAVSFDLLAGANAIPARLELIGGASNTRIYAEIPASTWNVGVFSTLSTTMNASNWRVFTDELGAGPAVDTATFADVLSNVSTFRIRLDLVDGLDSDSHRIDNVTLLPSPAAASVMIAGVGASVARRKRRTLKGEC